MTNERATVLGRDAGVMRKKEDQENRLEQSEGQKGNGSLLSPYYCRVTLLYV